MPLMNDPAIWFNEFFIRAGICISVSSILIKVDLATIVLFMSWLSNIVANRFMAGLALKACPAWYIKLSANQMLKIGDWIIIPSGDVITNN